MKKSVVKRFVLKGETVRALQNIELGQVIGGAVSLNTCVRSMDPIFPCECTDARSGCMTTVQAP